MWSSRRKDMDMRAAISQKVLIGLLTILYIIWAVLLIFLRFLLLFPEVIWYVCIKAERTVMEIAGI
jgi:hypothetical protein